MENIYPLLSYTFILILFAYLNKQEIHDKNKRIYHGINGALHMTICIYCFLEYCWETGFSMVLLARLVFDSCLNVFRKKGIDYVPLEPKALTDQLEQFIFGMNWWKPKLTYVISLVVLMNFGHLKDLFNILYN